MCYYVKKFIFKSCILLTICFCLVSSSCDVSGSFMTWILNSSVMFHHRWVDNKHLDVHRIKNRPSYVILQTIKMSVHLVVFYYLGAVEIWPNKRGDFWREWSDEIISIWWELLLRGGLKVKLWYFIRKWEITFIIWRKKKDMY